MMDKPASITQLVGRCEVGEESFSNDDMSVALKFGELLWRRLEKMADHYERQSGNFMPRDIRGPMMQHASDDMRHVLNNTAKDMKQ